MIDREPGPLELVDARSIARLPLRGSFTQLVAEHVGNLAGADARLQTSSAAIASVPADVNDGLDGDIGAGLEGGLDAPGAGVASDGNIDIERGDNNDQMRAAVQDVLPPVDTPIDMSFEEPPGPPHLDRSPVEDKNERDERPEILL